MPLDIELIKGLGMAKYRGAEQGREEMMKREQLGLMQEQVRQAPIRTKMMQQDVQLGQMAIDEKMRFGRFEEEVKNEWQANPDVDVYGIIDKVARKYGLPGQLIEAYKQQNQLTEMATKTMLTIHQVYGPEKANEFATKDPILSKLGTPNIREGPDDYEILFDIPGLPPEAKGKMAFKVKKGDQPGHYREVTPIKVETGVEEKAKALEVPKFAQSLRKEFQDIPAVKNFQEVGSIYDIMGEAHKESKITKTFVAVDQAMIMLYNKMMDLRSVVRESEYARTPHDMSLWNRAKGAVERLKGGGPGLTQEERNAIYLMGGKFMDVYRRKHNTVVKQYRQFAIDAGVAPSMIFAGQEEVVGPQPEQPKQPKTAQPGGKENLRQKYNY